MVKTLVNILLAILFTCLAVIIIMPFMAEAQFEAAEGLVTQYLWKDAEKMMEEAIKISPYNSRYPAGLGEFLFTQSGYKDDPVPLLNKAQDCYERAARLNPRCAEYQVKLGQIKLSFFLEDTSKTRYIRDAFANFKKAIENDPNGFNVAYAVGYSGLSVWKDLDEGEKAIVIDRLRYSLKQKPWYSEYIYPRLLQETGSVKLLELIMPEIEVKQWVDPEKIESMKRGVSQDAVSDVISRSGWQGASADGRNIYENGNMYWKGTIYAVMRFTKGEASIKVEAKGSPADGVYPYMLVSLDGKRAGSAYVDSAEFKEYSFAADTDDGIKVLSVTFTNDGGNSKEDRNLFIGKARVEKR